MIDVKALQKEIREINEMNGWYDAERPFSSDIALLHSEVDELAWAVLMGGEDDNSPEEMADIFIRLLDTSERYGFNITMIFDQYDPSAPRRQGSSLIYYTAFLSIHISHAYEGYRKSLPEAMEVGLAQAYKELLWAAEDFQVDLLAEVRTKLERNRQRGYKYGGKVE